MLTKPAVPPCNRDATGRQRGTLERLETDPTKTSVAASRVKERFCAAEDNGVGKCTGFADLVLYRPCLQSAEEGLRDGIVSEVTSPSDARFETMSAA